MKLLLEQNIPLRLAEGLADLYPGSGHVREAGLEDADDCAVWDYAKEHDFTIVSTDEDFHQRSAWCVSPPKVVSLRLGSCTTQEIESALRRNRSVLTDFVAQGGASFLVIRREQA